MTQKPPESFWDRLTDTLFVRRADQTIIAVIVLACLIALGVWWWRGGGLHGLVDHDDLPNGGAAFVVDVNTADVDELQELPGVGASLAERIIAQRRAAGPFQSFDDLKEVKGIGEKTLERMRPHVSFGK